MSVAPNKRSIITLYSKNLCPYSHRVRIVLAEKGVTVDILDIDKNTKTREELNELNPYGTTPTLVDRELVIYTSEIIMEYLDERFPHPPLMPVYPVARARTRLMIYRINRNWYSLMDKILNYDKDQEIQDRKTSNSLEHLQNELRDSIVSIAPAFSEMPFFLSEEFSLIDCCIIPLLWRLPMLGIELPSQAKSVLLYEEKMFQRESFVESLTEEEKAIRT